MSALADSAKLKICMAGEAGVGKTSLIRRYVLDEFDDRYVATLGTKITKKSLTVRHPSGTGNALDAWASSIRSVAGDIPTYGVVNKEDLNPQAAMSSTEVESFFRSRGWAWSYASAKSGRGVEEIFQGLVTQLLAGRA